MNESNQENVGAAKPQMSYTEASFHEVTAGNRAKRAAEQTGGNPEAIKAVADATIQHKVVAGYELKPASQGTIFALQEVAKRFEEYCLSNPMHSSGDMENPGTKELLEITIAVLVFADPRRCYEVVQEGRIDDLRYEAEDLIWNLPAEQAKALNDHFAHEMERVNSLSGADDVSPPGKPQVAERLATGASMPPSPVSQVTGSPSWSGSCPPTVSHSQPPSGTSPSP